MKYRGTVTTVHQRQNGSYSADITFPVKIRIEPHDWEETIYTQTMHSDVPIPVGTPIEVEMVPNPPED